MTAALSLVPDHTSAAVLTIVCKDCQRTKAYLEAVACQWRQHPGGEPFTFQCYACRTPDPTPE